VVTREYAGNEAGRIHAVQVGAPRLISCCPEELVEVELEALRQGGERARADGAGALHDMAAIGQAAADACGRALADQYIPLDEHKFREVFTLAWCAGYHAEVERTRS
jgi:hypothetical protein